jgi:hypothetical protein
MDLLIALGCIILGLIILWIAVIIVVAVVAGVHALILRRRVIKRQKEIRSRLTAQGAPYARLEARRAPIGLRTAY